MTHDESALRIQSPESDFITRPEDSTDSAAQRLEGVGRDGGGDREVRAVLGEGGMGKVYLAYEKSLEREVALKEISAELARREDGNSSFVREARVAARLHHPGIVPVHALTSGPRGDLAFTMQAVVGRSFFSWMREPEQRVGSQERLERGLEAFLKVCDTLAYVHSQGVLHCDLKPENVMIGDFGSVYLMDWGLARLIDDDLPAGPCGTPAYMAPEQARNERLDVRSDVFGVGAILYELVSGKTPYGRGSSDECLARAMSGSVVDIVDAARHVGVSRRLCRIVRRAVAPNANERYPSVVALRDEVRAFLLGGFHLPRLAFPAGSLLVKEGDLAQAAYLLVSGRCRVFRRADAPDAPPRILEPGDIFGELALLLGEPRTASIEALEDCTVLVIEQETIEASGATEGWTATLLQALARRFRELERRHDGG
jgi:serine/threonine-protein kinase